MIEPTETESRETLERFAKILLDIAQEDPEFLHDAPHSTPISRPDEVAAARTPILRWKPNAVPNVECSNGRSTERKPRQPAASTA